MLHRHLYAIFTAAALCLGPVVAHAGAPATDTREPESPADDPLVSQPPLAVPLAIHIEVSASQLSQSTLEGLNAELEKQWPILVEKLGIRDADAAEADAILRLEFGQPNSEERVYVVSSLVQAAGSTVRRGGAETCIQCNHADLAARALAIVPEAVNELRRKRRRDAHLHDDEPPAPGVEDEACGAQSLNPGVAARVHLGNFGKLGVGVGAVGLGAAIAGLALTFRGVEPVSEVSQRDYRAAGVGAGISGLGFMVLGTALIAIDLAGLMPERSRPTRNQTRNQTRVQIGLSPSGGVVVRGAF